MMFPIDPNAPKPYTWLRPWPVDPHAPKRLSYIERLIPVINRLITAHEWRNKFNRRMYI